MQKNEQPVSNNGYIVPKGQEQVVHYKIAKMSADGSIIEKPRICHTNPKMFDGGYLRNLELLGYSVEILYHPLGKYTATKIVDKDETIKEKDAEIERLKALLAEVATPKDEAPKEETKKVGRPKKED